MNALSQETSPYLLQHANNPVEWLPWGEEALEKARKENKPLIISIGYSSCHWCHVMELQSFEDKEVAQIMNEHFVPIKVDREERPDVDQVYMDAVQLLTGGGGWPLNCFALPDGRPFYGGTYFPKNQWIQLITAISKIFKDDPERLKDDADRLTDAIRSIAPGEEDIDDVNLPTIEELRLSVENWKKNWDEKNGGPNYAPKFPMPSHLIFLLKYSRLYQDEQAFKYVQTTLEKMALGGIFDHISGGFARYSTDKEWKVPHFEKMLYDNAQLISLYSKAFIYFRDPLFKETVNKIIRFVSNDLYDDLGGYHSAIDADSEGEEGRFYVWNKDELKAILKDDFGLAEKYFHIDDKGYWEKGNFVLVRKTGNPDPRKLASITKLLDKHRSKRENPGKDDKIITSWNCLLAKAFFEAGMAFGKREYIEKGNELLNFILSSCSSESSGLFHILPKGKKKINGFLEDYCFLIEALIARYSALLDENDLMMARKYLDHVIDQFYDESRQLFRYTSAADFELIATKYETNDNVIPSSNSSMATNLHILGKYFENEKYLKISENMSKRINENLKDHITGYTNWAQLVLTRQFPHHEIAIVGPDAHSMAMEIAQQPIHNYILLGGDVEGSLPLLKNKYVEGKTMIYVCVEKTCKQPVNSVVAALEQVN